MTLVDVFSLNDIVDVFSTYFTLSSSVSIVNLEHVITGSGEHTHTGTYITLIYFATVLHFM